jgi:hypothetical protein
VQPLQDTRSVTVSTQALQQFSHFYWYQKHVSKKVAVQYLARLNTAFHGNPRLQNPNISSWLPCDDASNVVPARAESSSTDCIRVKTAFGRDAKCIATAIERHEPVITGCGAVRPQIANTSHISLHEDAA